jgi:fructosamine-3-kinase
VNPSSSAASRIARLTGLAVREARVAGSQHGYQHLILTLAGGRRAFAKVAAVAAPDPAVAAPDPAVAAPDPAEAASGDVAAAFAAEANGLRWLAEAAAVPVPEVLAVNQAALVISMIPPGQAMPEAAFRFGAELARLHAAGAGGFGAPWRGFIARLPLDNTPAPPVGGAGHRGTNPSSPLAPPAGTVPSPGWPEWYARRRLLPYLRTAVDCGALRPEDGRLVEAVIDRIGSLAGPAEPPSRLHGDCWAGNVLWSGGQGWLIDPAAHGGHRETDLAMLALFGAPYLDRILAGYNDTVPLAAGWRSRVPLHQLHPLLVHACLFGASYRDAVRSAAHAALSG